MQNVSFNRLNLGNGTKKAIIDLSCANRTIAITDTTQYAVQFGILSVADVLWDLEGGFRS